MKLARYRMALSIQQSSTFNIDVHVFFNCYSTENTVGRGSAKLKKKKHVTLLSRVNCHSSASLIIMMMNDIKVALA